MAVDPELKKELEEIRKDAEQRGFFHMYRGGHIYVRVDEESFDPIIGAVIQWASLADMTKGGMDNYTSDIFLSGEQCRKFAWALLGVADRIDKLTED